MDGTILGQGTFTQPATAVQQVIAIPSGCDWIEVRNYTQIATPVGGTGIRFFWQQGMPVGTAFQDEYNGGATAINTTLVANPNGFTVYDPSQTQNALGPAVAVTAVTNAVQPVVDTGSTAGLVNNVSIVRLSGVAAQLDIMGIDFLINGIVANTSFTIANALATAPGAVGGAGFYRIVNFNPLFYPRRRTIVNITQAASAVVTTSLPHGYTVGQAVRFNIPAAASMVQMNGLQGFITAVTTNTFTVNINSTAFTAFTFPTAAQMPSSFPEVTPFGEDTATALNLGANILGDATLNTGFLGMILPIGANSPGGQALDVVYWIAGKSTYGGL